MEFLPFRGLRPAPNKANEVASPPYDVLNTEEARSLADTSDSFLYVVKPEIAFPAGKNPADDDVYLAGRNALRGLVDRGAMSRDNTPGFYLYRQTMGEHVQIGVVGLASVDDYDEGRIKKHEYTRKSKEDDRTRHVDTLGANTGPVFLTYRTDPVVTQRVSALSSKPPSVEVTRAGVRHELWVIDEPAEANALREAFGAVEAFYVADGHHRSASASRTRELRRNRNTAHTGDEDYNRFLTVVFADDELQILAYNRVVRDLANLTPETLLEKITERFEVSEGSSPIPSEPGRFGMYLAGRWYGLKILPAYRSDDPVEGLDVALLQRHLLSPLLEVGDPRSDERIDFVGGIRGTTELERVVDNGSYAIAFSLYPTSVAQLLAVADSGAVMPPKSTWFEPKLLSGLFVHLLDGDGPA